MEASVAGSVLVVAKKNICSMKLPVNLVTEDGGLTVKRQVSRRIIFVVMLRTISVPLIKVSSDRFPIYRQYTQMALFVGNHLK